MASSMYAPLQEAAWRRQCQREEQRLERLAELHRERVRQALVSLAVALDAGAAFASAYPGHHFTMSSAKSA